jgi:hypothetical protein
MIGPDEESESIVFATHCKEETKVVELILWDVEGVGRAKFEHAEGGLEWSQRLGSILSRC